MQKLTFEPAWDRTVAPKDRLEIQRVFSESDHDHMRQNIVVLKTAFNHKKEYLVTVLINNYNDDSFSLNGKTIIYEENGQKTGEFNSKYLLVIPAHTSMPWTFIFPASCLERKPSGESGDLTIL